MRQRKESPVRRPATTNEGREHQLVAMAMDYAEQQMLEGKASSQVVSHFLKLGTEREALERQRLQQENELLKAKVEALASAKRVEALYADALSAMRTYSGQEPADDDDQDV